MGYEANDDDRDHDHDKDCQDDGDHGHDDDKGDDYHHKYCKYKKERDEYKAYLKAALERLGIAVHKLGHLLDDLADGSKKIGKDHDHGKDHDKDCD